MKITCSRRDDLLREQAEYDAAMKAYDDSVKKQWDDYHQGVEDVYNPIVNEIKSNLDAFTSLVFNVKADLAWGDDLRISIDCNNHRVFDENSALSWSYEAVVNKKSGEVVRKTSSWSGMSAVTPAQMKSLHETVDALDYLNSIDWNQLLELTFPQYEDYADPNAPARPDSRDFRSELRDATLEDLVGTNQAIAIQNPGTESIVYGSPVLFAKILKISGSQYTIQYAPGTRGWGRSAEPDAEYAKQNFANGTSYTGRIRKDKLIPYNPETIIDL